MDKVASCEQSYQYELSDYPLLLVLVGQQSLIVFLCFFYRQASIMAVCRRNGAVPSCSVWCAGVLVWCGVLMAMCWSHPHDCDCSKDDETCLNLTEFGSSGFPLFGQTMNLFEGNIDMTLEIFNEGAYEHTPLAQFFALDYGPQSHDGSVRCQYDTGKGATTTVQNFIRSAYAADFGDFNATEVVTFVYENIQSNFQVIAAGLAAPGHGGCGCAGSGSGSGFGFGSVFADSIDPTLHNITITLATDGTHTFAIYFFLALPGSLPEELRVTARSGVGYTFPRLPFPQDIITFGGSAVPPGVNTSNILANSNADFPGAYVFRVDQLSCSQQNEFYCLTDYVKKFTAVDVQVDQATFQFTEEFYKYVEIEYTVTCTGIKDSITYKSQSVTTQAPTVFPSSKRPPNVITSKYNPLYTVTVDGLLGGTNYSCVATKSFDNFHPDHQLADISTPILEITTLTGIPSSIPLVFTCEATSDSQVKSTWTEIPPQQQNGLVEYTFSLTSADQVDKIVINRNSAPLSPILVDGLRPDTSYFCVLSVVTAAGILHSTVQSPVTFSALPTPNITTISGNCSVASVSVAWSNTAQGPSQPVTGVNIVHSLILMDISLNPTATPFNVSLPNNAYTVKLGMAARIITRLRFQVQLESGLSSSGSLSSPVDFSCVSGTVVQQQISSSAGSTVLPGSGCLLLLLGAVIYTYCSPF